MNTMETIVRVLKELAVDQWILRQERISSRELFFIGKKLDMNRAKEVTRYDLTLYRLYEEEGQAYKGSASLILPAQISREEIISRLEKAWYAAYFVKNRPYPMAEPETTEFALESSRLDGEDINSLLEELRLSLYKNDTHTAGGINSAEIFINQHNYRLLTSTGIDETYSRKQGDIELICDWQENGEDVELYNMFSFADMNRELLEKECREQLENCRLRSQARQSPELKNINIILTGEAVREMMDFYHKHSSARGVYEKIARGKKGEVFQGEDAVGDLISMTLEPALEGSCQSVPYDRDGKALKTQEIYRKGKLLRYHGSMQYTHYLGEEPTGIISNQIVEGGKSSVQDWKKEPHVEIRSFSDFQMSPMTGDFGGEIRLALWFDGEKTHPLTGASLSASLFDIQKEFYLSSERIRRGNYYGPAYLMYPNGHLGGKN